VALAVTASETAIVTSLEQDLLTVGGFGGCFSAGTSTMPKKLASAQQRGKALRAEPADAA
jgi:hypothetical protein